MNNPLAGQGASPKGAEAAQAAITQGRKVGAKTQRERDYLEAVAVHYEDFGNRPERARQEARAKAYEALVAKYPDDDEAQIFAALVLAAGAAAPSALADPSDTEEPPASDIDYVAGKAAMACGAGRTRPTR